MMKQELSDKGLRRALQKPMSHRLSSNFTFRMMQKVEETVRLKEQKQERWMWIATLVASVCLLVGGVVTISFYWGEEVKVAFTGLKQSFVSLDLLSSPYSIFAVILLILLGFDFWMRRAYYKRHPKDEIVCGTPTD